MTARQQTCGDAGGRKADGAPCGSHLGLGATGLCLMHDPARETERDAARIRGGTASGVSKRLAKVAEPKLVPKPPKTLEDAVTFASWLSHAVCIGTLDARTAHESAYALNCFKAAVEKRDLLREVEKLRTELDAARKAQRSGRV